MVLGADDLSLELIVDRYADEEIPEINGAGFYVLLSNHSNKEVKINRWNTNWMRDRSPFKLEIIEVVDNDQNNQLPNRFFKSWDHKLIEKKPKTSIFNRELKSSVIILEPFGHYVFLVSPYDSSWDRFPFYIIGSRVQVKLQAIFEGQDLEGRKISLKSKIKDVNFVNNNK